MDLCCLMGRVMIKNVQKMELADDTTNSFFVTTLENLNS